MFFLEGSAFKLKKNQSVSNPGYDTNTVPTPKSIYTPQEVSLVVATSLWFRLGIQTKHISLPYKCCHEKLSCIHVDVKI